MKIAGVRNFRLHVLARTSSHPELCSLDWKKRYFGEGAFLTKTTRRATAKSVADRTVCLIFDLAKIDEEGNVSGIRSASIDLSSFFSDIHYCFYLTCSTCSRNTFKTMFESRMARVFKSRVALSATFYNKRYYDDESEAFCIDDFKIVAILGRGSFGKVALCHHGVTGKTFAVKCTPRRPETNRGA